MPNVKYSAEKGLITSSGTGGFTLEGVGLALDSETSSTAGNLHPISANGVSTVTATDDHTGLIAAPKQASLAGQQKLVIKATADNTLTLRDASGAVPTGAVLNGANDFALLVWTGSRWFPIVKNIT